MDDGSFVSGVGGAQEVNIVEDRKLIQRNLEEIQQQSMTERVDDWLLLSDPQKTTYVSPGTSQKHSACFQNVSPAHLVVSEVIVLCLSC